MKIYCRFKEDEPDEFYSLQSFDGGYAWVYDRTPSTTTELCIVLEIGKRVLKRHSPKKHQGKIIYEYIVIDELLNADIVEFYEDDLKHENIL